jgi:hypothetical protein
MSSTRAFYVLILALLLPACVLPARSGTTGGAPTGTIAIVADDPNDDPKYFGRPGDPAGYSHSKAMAAQCNCFADVAEKSLDAAVVEARGKGGGHPAVDLSTMLLLSCAGAGAPQLPAVPLMPRIGPARRAGDIATRAKALDLDLAVAADASMHATPPGHGGQDGAALEGLASSVSSALRMAIFAEQQCNAMALQRGTSLVMNVSTRDVNSGLSDLPGYVAKERARLHRVIAAAKRADGIAAGASALAASLRHSVQTGNPKTVDATADALAGALPVAPMTASDEELDALMVAADHDASVILENAHEWARQQVAAGHGIGGPSRMAPAAGAGQAVMTEGDASDAMAIAGAFMGLLHGDVGAVVRGAAVLFPKDSPIRNGLTATGALLRGDVVTAVRSAAKMVPRGTAIGDALATAEGLISTAQGIAGMVKR